MATKKRASKKGISRKRVPKKRTPADALADAERLIAECRDTRSPVLGLNALGLRELPESLRALRWLSRLNLEDNEITHLPNWLGDLAQLRELTVSSYSLKTIPASIGRLTELNSLFLRHPLIFR